MKKVLTAIFISILATFSVVGQSLDSLLIASEKLYKSTESLLVFPRENNAFTFNSSQTPDSSYTYYEIQLKKAYQKALRNDIGLALKANAQYNLNSDFDIETNNFTKSRIKTELEWNILKLGFLSNRVKAQQLENKIALLSTKTEKEQRISWRRQFRLQYTYSINEELITLFKQKKDFLTNYFDVIAMLYAQKRIKREMFIDISQQIGTTKTELKNTQKFNKQLQDSLSRKVFPKQLPFIEIDGLHFRENVNLKKINDSLQRNAIALQHHWVHDISLSVYGNYNWLQTNIINRNFASIGLRLRVPLRFSNKQEIIVNTTAREKAFYDDKTVGSQNKFSTYYNSYREKVRDLKNQYKNWQIIQERKRIFQVLKEELQSNDIGVQQLKLQLTQFEILENTLRLKMQLYTAFSHLYELNPQLKMVPLTFKKLDITAYSAFQMNYNPLKK